jgi:hypothetical protein
MSEGMLNVEGYEDDDEEEVASVQSGQSVSDYDGDMKQVPPTMYFGEDLCRAKFLMTGTGNVVHVCGKRVVLCRRPGHRVLRDSGTTGVPGFYDTLRVNMTIDGNAATYMTADELAVKLAGQRAENLAVVETLFGSPENTEVSPSSDGWTMTGGVSGQASRFAFEANDPGSTVSPTSEVTQGQVPPSSFEGPTARQTRFADFPGLPARTTLNAAAARSPTGLIPASAEEAAGALALERAATRTKIAELTERLWALNAHEPMPPSHLGPVRGGAVGTAAIQPPVPSPLPRQTALPARFFAAFGLDGRSGVYSSFQMAVSVVGIDSSILEYTDLDQAMAAVLKWRQHEAAVAARLQCDPSPGTRPGLPTETMASVGSGLGTGIASGSASRSITPGPGDEGFFPPAKLMGPDPNKESDTFYGLEVGSERTLRRGMAPADVDDDMAKDMATAMLDAVAVPGTSSVSSGGDVDQQMTDLGLVGGAIHHLVDQAADERSGRERIRVDSAWQSSSRNSLGSVKSAEMLQPRFSDLTGLRDKVFKSFHRRLQNILTNAGWSEIRAQAWAMTGYHAKIATGTYNAYVSLHLHLVGLSNRGVPWATLNLTIKHHVKKLGEIRSYSECRLQALCKIYCYLRNGQAVNWYVAELQAERLLELQLTGASTPVRSNVSNPDAATTRKVCPKCLSLVHTGGKAKCPWKDESDKVAIAAANKVMAGAAAGIIVEK